MRSRATEAATGRMGTMHIGEVAERVGLSLRTIRHDEDEGLITPAGRTKGGFRLYDEADCQRLLILTLMKPLEYSLEEMRDLASSTPSAVSELISTTSRSPAWWIAWTPTARGSTPGRPAWPSS